MTELTIYFGYFKEESVYSRKNKLWFLVHVEVKQSCVLM